MSSELKLTEITPEQLRKMMTWFNSETELKDWAGPNFTYPYDVKSFTKDLTLDSLDSFSLLSHEAEFLAFGQCYERLQRCHLGRLVVAPEHRGKNHAAQLMRRLIEFGTKKFHTRSCSLFVLEKNTAAISAYRKFGFEFETYPQPIPFENCHYMVKNLGSP